MLQNDWTETFQFFKDILEYHWNIWFIINRRFYKKKESTKYKVWKSSSMSNCDSLLNIFINQCSFQKLSVHNFVEFNQERESDERASLCTKAKKLIEQQRSNAASILEVLGTVQAYMIRVRCFCIRFCFNFRRGIYFFYENILLSLDWREKCNLIFALQSSSISEWALHSLAPEC